MTTIKEFLTKGYIKEVNINKLSEFDTWVELMRPCKKHNVVSEDWYNMLLDYAKDDECEFDRVVRHVITTSCIDTFDNTIDATPVTKLTEDVCYCLLTRFRFPATKYFYNLVLEYYMEENTVHNGGRPVTFTDTNAQNPPKDSLLTINDWLQRVSSCRQIMRMYHNYETVCASSQGNQYKFNKLIKDELNRLEMDGEYYSDFYKQLLEYGVKIAYHVQDHPYLYPVYLAVIKYGCCDPRILLCSKDLRFIDRYIRNQSYKTQIHIEEFDGCRFYDTIDQVFVTRLMDLKSIEVDHPETSKQLKMVYYKSIKDKSLQLFIRFMESSETDVINYLISQQHFSTKLLRHICATIRRRYPELGKYVNSLEVTLDRAQSKYRGMVNRKDMNAIHEINKIYADMVKSIVLDFLYTDNVNFDKFVTDNKYEIRPVQMQAFKLAYPETQKLLIDRISTDPESGYHKRKQAYAIYMNKARKVIDKMIAHQLSITEYYHNTKITPDEMMSLLIREQIILNISDAKKVRTNLSQIKTKSVPFRPKIEFNSNSILCGHLVTDDEKRYVIAYMQENEIPLYRPIYIELLKDYINNGALSPSDYIR